MARPFVSEFLLPLVQGGTLAVGRPLASRDIPGLVKAYRTGMAEEGEADAVEALAAARRRALLVLVAEPPALPLDEQTWRLGAAVHDLLSLAHPRIGTGPGADWRIERVATAATSLANLGAPATLAQTLARHSLLGRLPEVARVDHTVRFWLGRRTFIGRQPPARMLSLPRLRNVRVESVRRTWLRDVGIQAAARPAFAALTEASPLGEALDPLRLDPPWSWGRVLSILKFPVLCRVVAGRLVDLGVERTGDALSQALYRFVSLQDTAGPVAASSPAVAFALGFIAHLVWLEHLFEAPRAESAVGGDVGRDLALLLAVAAQVESDLIWPPDIPRDSTVGRGFARRLQMMFERHDVARSPGRPAALDLVHLAAVAVRPRQAANAV